jgi:dTDP-4-amino-4,6-dideoxygalactose transaminase
MRKRKWPEISLLDSIKMLGIISSGVWGGFPYPGKQSIKLMKKFKDTLGGKYASLCSNGTVAISIALRSLGVKYGDQVIMPAYTFSGVVFAVLNLGAIPVFIDSDPLTLCLNISKIEAKIFKRTKCIIAVHTGSRMFDVLALKKIADSYQIPFIEDCAHVHGAEWNGIKAGTTGIFGTFSLQSSKPLTSGEGGIIISNSKHHILKTIELIDCGREHKDEYLHHTENTNILSGNYRMSEMASALALIGLKRFKAQQKRRMCGLAFFEKEIKNIDGIKIIPHQPHQNKITIFRYIILINKEVIKIKNSDLINIVKYPEYYWVGFSSLPHLDIIPKWINRNMPDLIDSYIKLNPKNEFTESCNIAQMALWVDESIFREPERNILLFTDSLKKAFNDLK